MAAIGEMSTGVAVSFNHKPEWDEAVATALDTCNRLVYDWLIKIDPLLLNAIQKAWLDGYKAEIQNVITPPTPPPPPPPVPALRVQVVCVIPSGVSSDSSNIRSSSGRQKYQLAVSFNGSAPKPPTCGTLPPMLFNRMVGTGTNNYSYRMRLSGTMGTEPSSTPATADEIASSVLNGNLSWGVTPLAGFPLLVERITNPPIPDELYERAAPWDDNKVTIENLSLNNYLHFDGWTVYVEVIELRTYNVWWCCVGIPFEPFEGGTSWLKGTENITVNPYDLFKSHPGNPMAMLEDYIISEGSGGEWTGRFFVDSAEIQARSGKAGYDGCDFGWLQFGANWGNMVRWPYEPGRSRSNMYIA